MLNLERKLLLIKSVVMQHTNDIKMLREDCTDIKTSSMSYNVLLHRVPEKEGENCTDKVKGLLQNLKYSQPLNIERAHHLGPLHTKPNRKDTHPRPIVARLAGPSQVDQLLKFGSEHKDKLVPTGSPRKS